jgi:hypothetical protein
MARINTVNLGLGFELINKLKWLKMIGLKGDGGQNGFSVANSKFM